LSDKVNPKLKLKHQVYDINDVEVHLCSLLDNQQFNDDKGRAEEMGISSAQWPLFGQIWDSSIVLANHMSKIDLKGQKILEIGCGIALASHFLNQQGENITATDYHPDVESFLKENAKLNEQEEIPFKLVDWSNLDSKLGRFNLIIGSDLLYMQDHPDKLASFINKHADANSVVIIVDPGRKLVNEFTRLMHLNEFKHESIIPSNLTGTSKPFKGLIHYYARF
jgi:predicted nicotinamide N-methyase